MDSVVTKAADRRASAQESMDGGADEKKFECYIEKKSRTGMWNKRWFMITNHYLVYYLDDRKKEDEGGQLDLRLCNLVVRSGRVVTLHLHNNTRYQLRFNQQSTAVEWEAKLYRTTIDCVPLSPNSAAESYETLDYVPMTPSGMSAGGGTPPSASSASSPGSSGGEQRRGSAFFNLPDSPRAGAAGAAGSADSSNSGAVSTEAGARSVAEAVADEINEYEDFFYETEGESFVGAAVVRCWLGAALFALLVAAISIVPVPTLDLWFFKVCVDFSPFIHLIARRPCLIFCLAD